LSLIRCPPANRYRFLLNAERCTLNARFTITSVPSTLHFPLAIPQSAQPHYL
jgi:hypothetical protein